MEKFPLNIYFVIIKQIEYIFNSYTRRRIFSIYHIIILTLHCAIVKLFDKLKQYSYNLRKQGVVKYVYKKIKERNDGMSYHSSKQSFTQKKISY